MVKIVEAIYENGVFRPLEKVELREGERVKIVIKKGVFGILKGWKVDAQKVKDELREIHG